MDSQLNNIVEKALDKIPVDKAYADLAQAGLKKAGIALADIIEIVTIPLLPLLHVKKKIALYLDENLRRYEDALQKKQEEPIVVPLEIGVPILQKLTLSNGELAEAFIKLLTNASFEDSIHQVHPAFITTLSELSRDEAIILKSVDPNKPVAVVNVYINYMQKENPEKYAFSRTPYPKLTGFEKLLELHFRQNISLYIQNLERLGIFRYEDGSSLVNCDADYQRIEELYSQEIEIARQHAVNSEVEKGQKAELQVNRALIDITPFGREFILACLSNKEVKTSN